MIYAIGNTIGGKNRNMFCRKCGSRLDYEWWQHEATCPNCGYNMPVPDDNTRSSGSYPSANNVSGNRVSYGHNESKKSYIEDRYSYNESYSTYREIKDAEIVKQQEETKRKRIASRNDIINTVFLFLILLACIGYLYNFFDERKREEREREEIAQTSKALGLLCGGTDEEYIGEDYKAVVEHLKAIGFTNITTVDSKDAGLKFWTNKEVKSISIDGKSDFDEYDYFYPDVKIIITYH